MTYLLLAIPVLLMIFREKYKKYIFSPLVTLSCLTIALFSKGEYKMYVILAYAFSVAGDYFLAHQKSFRNAYLYGIGGFFAAHVFFLVYAAVNAGFTVWLLVCAAALLIPYSVFLFRGLYPNIPDAPMRIAVTLYMLISASVLSVSLGMQLPAAQKALYITGIGMILFSDTLIALDDFMHRNRLARLIMPTYFLCHILVAASLIL